MESIDLMRLVAIVGAFSIPILAIILGIASNVYHVRQKERSRREIAAYIAEGAMTADEGERLMAAGKGRCKH